MKKIKFCDMFLIFSWILFFATNRSIYAAIMLMLAGAYKLCDIVPALWKEVRKNAKREA